MALYTSLHVKAHIMCDINYKNFACRLPRYTSRATYARKLNIYNIPIKIH